MAVPLFPLAGFGADNGGLALDDVVVMELFPGQAVVQQHGILVHQHDRDGGHLLQRAAQFLLPGQADVQFVVVLHGGQHGVDAVQRYLGGEHRSQDDGALRLVAVPDTVGQPDQPDGRAQDKRTMPGCQAGQILFAVEDGQRGVQHCLAGAVAFQQLAGAAILPGIDRAHAVYLLAEISQAFVQGHGFSLPLWFVALSTV